MNNPLGILFCSGRTLGGRNSVSVVHWQFVRGVLSQSTMDVALFVDQNTWDAAPIVGVLVLQR